MKIETQYTNCRFKPEYVCNGRAKPLWRFALEQSDPVGMMLCMPKSTEYTGNFVQPFFEMLRTTELRSNDMILDCKEFFIQVTPVCFLERLLFFVSTYVKNIVDSNNIINSNTAALFKEYQSLLLSGDPMSEVDMGVKMCFNLLHNTTEFVKCLKSMDFQGIRKDVIDRCVVEISQL